MEKGFILISRLRDELRALNYKASIEILNNKVEGVKESIHFISLKTPKSGRFCVLRALGHGWINVMGTIADKNRVSTRDLKEMSDCFNYKKDGLEIKITEVGKEKVEIIFNITIDDQPELTSGVFLANLIAQIEESLEKNFPQYI
jgi:hypothetical protein